MNALLNTATYAPAALGVLLAGHISWALLYVMVLRNVGRHHVVEIPPAAVAANFAYVTTWGLLNQSDLGALFVWANRGAVLLEGAVFLYVLFNGAKHVKLPEVRRWFKPGLVLSYVCWLLMLATFTRQHYELPSGLVSGFIVSMFMSILYVMTELAEIDPGQYSRTAGWAKLVGNGCGTVFCALAYPGSDFLLTVCAITVILDVVYVLLFSRRLALLHSGAAPSRAPV
ncbi:MAG: hypothetical protein ACO1Q7_12440 [Gemmatimonas sp.]